jgi:hypothetical protein
VTRYDCLVQANSHARTAHALISQCETAPGDAIPRILEIARIEADLARTYAIMAQAAPPQIPVR